MTVPSRPLVIGALHQDLVVRVTGNHRACASNPARIETSPGGVGANVARAIAAEGVDCDLIAPGEALETAGASSDDWRGVSVRRVPVPGCAPGRYIAVLDAAGELLAGYAELAACDAVEAEALLTAWPADSAGALVLDANLSARALAGLVAAATAPVAALAVSPAKAARLLPLARDVDLLFCNRREAAALGGLPDDALLETLGDGLEAVGFRSWVLTDGAAGALVRHLDGVTLVSAPTLQGELAGVNGAGDALAGATLAALARRPDLALDEAVRGRGLAAARRVLSGERRPASLD